MLLSDSELKGNIFIKGLYMIIQGQNDLENLISLSSFFDSCGS